MKKLLSTLFLIAVFTVASSAQLAPPCPKGHIETPGFVCIVPPADRLGSGNASEDSLFAAVTEWLSELDMLGYFVN